MKYRDLVQFEPIESVIQLRDASDAENARNLVESFVISPDLASTLVGLAIPQIQFENPADHKGLLVVGNYGTGKSHLMAVLSSVAENADLAASLTNPEVREAITQVAGRFQVARTEIGATGMPLREILVGELERRLDELGVAYAFPDADAVPNNKRCLEEMMAAFHERFPDQGLLLVVDELLDFLRSRKDQELILDLNFLRELAESCSGLRLRFVAGVQEAIFDSQRFAFAADSVRRVRDRFEQVLIARTDVQYVVAERLLKKTPEQRARIRQHLEPFGKFYGRLNESLDEYVALFPIHPDFIRTFERLAVVEKREVLKTFSLAMAAMLDVEVPESEPGLVAYDSYWETLTANASFRAIPDIREVIRCSEVLESRVRNAYSRRQYEPLAIRIIHALSVHRLTTGDIHASIGAAPAELRDALCLYQPGVEELGGDPALDLETMVATAVREIHRTVSGQFITENPRNGQYYLDLRKTDDFDALIKARAESLDHSQLDRYYYRALIRLMDVREDEAHVPGFRIWEHQLTWAERNTERPGYLFFGAPNERSTAAPPRDFYLYFLQPFEPPRFTDEKKADEVFFRLDLTAEGLREAIARFAGAEALAAQSSGAHKRIYQDKAEESLRELGVLLRKNMLDCYHVTCAGRNAKMGAWARGRSIRNLSGTNPEERIPFSDVVHAVAPICLEAHFRDTAPDYPTFGVLITKDSREQAARDALGMIAGRQPTRQARAILAGLELLVGGDIRPDSSRYAKAVLEILHAKPAAQVVGRDEVLVEKVRDVEYFDHGGMRLEPDWVVVLLAALVHSGHVVLTLPGGRKCDALNLSDLAVTPLSELRAFQHFARPKDWNLPGITALVEMLGLPAGVALQVTKARNEAVQQIQKAIAEQVEALARAGEAIHRRVLLWGESLFEAGEAESLDEAVGKTRAFLESLQVFNTPAKFKNFRHEADAVKAHESGLAARTEVDAISRLAMLFQRTAAWLSEALFALPADHSWIAPARKAQQEFLTAARQPANRTDPTFHRDFQTRLGALRKDYEALYLTAHRQARLGSKEAARRDELLRHERLRTLSRLAEIELLRRQDLVDIESGLRGLRECAGPTSQDFEKNPICPHCSFRIGAESTVTVAVESSLDNLERDLDQLVTRWIETLLTSLGDPIVQKSRTLLSTEQQAAIDAFIKTLESRQLPRRSQDSLIEAIRSALRGLEKVTTTRELMAKALFPGGVPATPDQLRERMDGYVRDLTQGRSPGKVRIVLE